MNTSTAVIAFAVRLVAENTTLIRKPEFPELLFSTFIGGETYDVKMARDIEAEAARAANAIKQYRTKRKFNKIVANA